MYSLVSYIWRYAPPRTARLMQERLAFTASFLRDAAVVCRAIEDRPGPIADLAFGRFETWTQAQAFARRLNEDLKLDPAEARQIVTSAILCTGEVWRDPESPWVPRNRLRAAAHESFSQPQGSVVATCECWAGSSENCDTSDSEKQAGE
jgi:hypothetical protein